MAWGVSRMFDIYVRGKGQILVVRRGAALPAGLAEGWRKKRAARTVSEEITRAIMREGFYARSQFPNHSRLPVAGSVDKTTRPSVDCR